MIIGRTVSDNMMGGMMNDMMRPMMLGMLLFWTLVIAALVLLVRRLWGRRPGSTSEDTVLFVKPR